jgi:hypothetical protein
MTETNKLQTIELVKIKEFTTNDGRVLTLFDCPESGEYVIDKKLSAADQTEQIRFPKNHIDQLQLMPDEYENVQNAIEEYNLEQRTSAVYADSLESFIGYDSLLRVMSKYFGSRVAFYRSEEGGSLTAEEARKEVYRENVTDEEAAELLDSIMRMPTEQINFRHLLELNANSPRTAQNLWETIKHEAKNEFESGHRAAAAFEPADYMADAWNRASYLGLRESLIEEWQPKGGIELTMIDAVAQAYLQLQFWTTESVKRAKTQPRQENERFADWKKWNKEVSPKQWSREGHWDLPLVTEQAAIEQAAQMADRWQRMYFRAIRSLRDWRRYTPQVTINNPNQVNIATDGGQQINVADFPSR